MTISIPDFYNLRRASSWILSYLLDHSSYGTPPKCTVAFRMCCNHNLFADTTSFGVRCFSLLSLRSVQTSNVVRRVFRVFRWYSFHKVIGMLKSESQKFLGIWSSALWWSKLPQDTSQRCSFEKISVMIRKLKISFRFSMIALDRWIATRAWAW